MQKIKKGDNVIVLLGKDRGKIGRVERILSSDKKIIVGGINLVKRHIGKKVTGQQGQILDIAKPLNLSNVSVICPNCKKPTRVGFKIEGNIKLRFCKKCKKEITK
ncbi:50S ribosomal protein L24 [Candidatus Daviesbacteria bacterium RIFCSPHIGHO2_12_FULL_37_11]|uniref:Large ribosomal subunit protein uL24 n=1 Tax=Candidatus Daviesbacteria bacterium RIFCSPHIGHO2_12_FULL_37_11 TaxID=1797777 RepID=A0A1F5KCQ4_9BACT|nr:MAG: 50S ribosomal protein L24 [Candidatus Daviesbacteria bacterium GWA1_38_6]OGE16460.1 MAG: 50S ribosomal protein L24 [Candidatus Daviesbacteria bacterium RIFCSPHIGHO2_01_FULL_37_27]OGE38555.1 MAG: 50S ribosomal protein L24 [Candidatus Daviesbacteria bacterium RIFCSPHIGHO2_12_FULL_37_11]OGE46266.1 MAG: 50S ribosomal protein L24 [Candidatus Daviesbacteria bacterium RIFCSPLOWO2_01_FULL_37_10]